MIKKEKGDLWWQWKWFYDLLRFRINAYETFWQCVNRACGRVIKKQNLRKRVQNSTDGTKETSWLAAEVRWVAVRRKQHCRLWVKLWALVCILIKVSLWESLLKLLPLYYFTHSSRSTFLSPAFTTFVLTAKKMVCVNSNGRNVPIWLWLNFWFLTSPK